MALPRGEEAGVAGTMPQNRHKTDTLSSHGVDTLSYGAMKPHTQTKGGPMGSWIAACLIVLAFVLMIVARIAVFARNQPKTDVIIGLLNSLSEGSACRAQCGCVSMGLGGADNG